MKTSDKARSSFWSQLAEPERAALRAAGSWSTFEPDSCILVEHEATDHVLVIRSGLTKVSSHLRAYREVLLALRGPGDIVGEMVGIGGGRRSATITALDEVHALTVDARQFAWFLGHFSHASGVLQRVLVDRLRDGDQCRVTAGTMNVGQRLAWQLLQFEQRYGVATGNGDQQIALALSQSDLAAFIGASQRAVSREIESWRQRGIIATGRRRLVIRQSTELRRIAGPNAPR